MSLQDLLAKLQKDYLSTLPEKIREIERCWNEKLLTDLETEFHKMKGTGKTYGIPELSDLGREMEVFCAAGDAETLAKAIPLAIALIEKVGKERSTGRAYDLSSDARYRTILMLDRTAKGA